MRSLRTLLAGLLLAAGTLLLLPGTAHACSCAAAGTKQYVDWADAVVWAEVDDVRMPALRGDTAHYLLDVATVYQGEVTERLSVASAASGAACGLEGIETGRRYVFFLERAGDDLTDYWDVAEGDWTANLCGGTGWVDREAIERVVGAGAPAGRGGAGAEGAPVGRSPRPGGPEQLPTSGYAYAGMGVGALAAAVTALLVLRRQRSGAA